MRPYGSERVEDDDLRKMLMVPSCQASEVLILDQAGRRARRQGFQSILTPGHNPESWMQDARTEAGRY